MTLLQKIIKNHSLIYLLTRYFTYFIQFVNSILIAKYLGPFYLGIWGFIYLVINYINQLNLGISHSVNLILSTNKEKELYVKKIVGNSVFMISLLAILIITFFTLTFVLNISIGEKYNIYDYVIPIIIIGVLMQFNVLFSNIFRVFGKVYELILNQSLFPLLLLLVLPFYRGEQLLWVAIFVHCVSVLISFIFFVLKTPVGLFSLLDMKIMKYIQIKGWYLFIYNISFYFIMISSRTFVSLYYSVKEFGYFTFSYQLASAVLLLLNSISFLIFPKMLNRFANQSVSKVKSLLNYLRLGYIFSCHLLVHFVILLFPLFIFLFPKYESSLSVFRLIALTVVIYTNAFGYQGLLMARGQEKKVAKIAFMAFSLNLILCYVLIDIVNVKFDYVILGTLLTYFVYVYFLSKKARKLLGINYDFRSVFNDVFSYRIMLPFVLSLLFIFVKLSNVYFIAPLILFLSLNRKQFIKVKEIFFKLINNPNIINI